MSKFNRRRVRNCRGNVPNKPNPKTLSTIVMLCSTAMLLQGCEQDSSTRFEKAFLAGCEKGTTKAVCSCVANELEKRYTPEQLAAATDSSQRFHEVIESAIDARLTKCEPE